MTILRTAATVAILGALAWMIDIDIFLNSIRQAHVGWMLVAGILLPVNIAFEVWKWRALLQTSSNPRITDVVGSILAGYALGLFTPARAGDYVGRVLYLDNDHVETAIQTGVDRLLSMSVYVGAGLVALILAFGIGIIEFSQSWIYVTILGSVLAASLAALTVCPALFHRVLSRMSRSDKWVDGIRFILRLSRQDAARLLILSAFRYLVFTSQLVALVLAFGGESSIPLMYLCASLVFFVKTMVPSFTFADLGIRETASVYFFGLIGVSTVAALNASLMLFALNLVIPAIAGAAFVSRLRIPVRFKHALSGRIGSIAR